MKELRSRQQRTNRALSERSERKQRERQELLDAPEREDERLTAPSHNLDLEALYSGRLEDPTREARLAAKRERLELKQAVKADERQSHLHTLYTRARHFITTPQQLNSAVDEAFGTDERPVTFGHDGFGGPGSLSIWANGRPERVQDMLNKANRQGARLAMDTAAGHSQVNKERMTRIAEALTGGRMEREGDARQ